MKTNSIKYFIVLCFAHSSVLLLSEFNPLASLRQRFAPNDARVSQLQEELKDSEQAKKEQAKKLSDLQQTVSTLQIKIASEQSEHAKTKADLEKRLAEKSLELPNNQKNNSLSVLEKAGWTAIALLGIRFAIEIVAPSNASSGVRS